MPAFPGRKPLPRRVGTPAASGPGWRPSLPGRADRAGDPSGPRRAGLRLPARLCALGSRRLGAARRARLPAVGRGPGSPERAPWPPASSRPAPRSAPRCPGGSGSSRLVSNRRRGAGEESAVAGECVFRVRGTQGLLPGGGGAGRWRARRAVLGVSCAVSGPFPQSPVAFPRAGSRHGTRTQSTGLCRRC